MDRRSFLRCTYQFSSLTAATALTSHVIGWGNTLSGAPAVSKIAWCHDLQAAHATAVEKNRPVLIVFTATWCSYCHKLVRELADNAEVTRMMNTQFVPTLLDFDKEAQIAKVLEVEVLPTTIVLSPQVDLVAFKAGYLKTSDYQKLLVSALKPAPEVRAAAASVPERK